MIIRIIFFLFLVSSCNVIETLSGGETKLDDEFFSRENNNSQGSTLFNDLISFYRFETQEGSTDTIRDRAGSNDLVSPITLTSGEISTGPAGFGNAFKCGLTAGVVLQNTSPSSLNFNTTGNFTISFWSRRLTYSPGSGKRIILFDSGLPSFYIQDHNADADKIYFELGSSFTTVAGYFDTVTTSNWRHFVLRVDRVAGFSHCIDGVCSAYSAQDTTGENISGADIEVCTEFTGQIDSLGIWQRTLSDGEVNELRNGVSGLDY